MTDVDMTIGQRLKKRREELGLAKKTAANLIDVTEQFLGQFEQDKKSIKLDTLIRVCTKYSVTADWVLGLPNAPEPPKTKSLPKGGSEMLGYLVDMSERSREQLLRIAKTLYEDDQQWRQREDVLKVLGLILDEAALTAIGNMLPSMLTKSRTPDAIAAEIMDTFAQNARGNKS